MEEVTKLYKDGFNSGYLLAKHEPELAAQLFKSANDHSEYFKGMHSGKQEYETEKAREHLKDNLHKETPSKDSKDVERNR